MLLLSPLFGAFIASMLMMIYAGIESSLTISDFFSLLKIFPIIFCIVVFISYLISIPIGVYLIKKRDEYAWSSGFFMFIAFILGTIIGLAFSIINYNIENSLLKAWFILMSFSFGAMFNASFYTALEKEFKKK